MGGGTFFGGLSAETYCFRKEPYEEQIKRASELLAKADAVLIGAGAGLSAAAGLLYSGKRFTDQFREFIKRYGVEAMPNMYAAGFYPFATEEERWGYWSKHVYVNRIEPEGLPLYKEVYELVKEKEYFILTTNVDYQFWKAGFEDARIFATQGDYGRIQCQRGCHKKTYDAVGLFMQMNEARKDCKIPSGMVPRCPVCGGPMAMNLRCDSFFVEDEHWEQASERYGAFLERQTEKRVTLLELGVGFNTPTIIRFPFEHMVETNKKWSLVRLNQNEAVVPGNSDERTVGIMEDIAKSIPDIGRKGSWL